MARYAREKLGLSGGDDRPRAATGTRTTYDVVAMIQVIAHFVDPRAAVAKALAMLAPGGYLLVESWNSASLDGARARCKLARVQSAQRPSLLFADEPSSPAVGHGISRGRKRPSSQMDKRQACCRRLVRHKFGTAMERHGWRGRFQRGSTCPTPPRISSGCSSPSPERPATDDVPEWPGRERRGNATSDCQPSRRPQAGSNGYGRFARARLARLADPVGQHFEHRRRVDLQRLVGVAIASAVSQSRLMTRGMPPLACRSRRRRRR